MIVATILLCSLISVNQGSKDFWPLYHSKSRLEYYEKAAVSTDAAPCAPIGRDIFKRHGSVVDAAIAVLICMGAHNPQSSGLGGGFLMMYYNRAEEKAYYIDSREVAPKRATVNMFRGNSSLASKGGLSIAVPSELAGFEAIHRRFGRLPWKDLFTPTIEMCYEGILVSNNFARALALSRNDLLRYDAIRKVFLKKGTMLYKAGERIRRPDLARTLETISEIGKRALYGPSKMATRFLADLKAAGSIIDSDDLRSYKPRMRKPVKINLRNHLTMFSTSLPGGGPVLALMLAILDGYRDLNEGVHTDEKLATLAYHRIVETFKYAYAQRSQMEDEDSVEMKQLLTKLTSRDYADYVRSLIDERRTYNDPFHYTDNKGFTEDHGTAHLSLVGPDGDAVAVTSTINLYFGSNVLSPSTGIVLNDQMDDFSSPNVTNAFEVMPSSANRIRPGKRPLSSVSPAIFVDPYGNVTLVIGGTGGTTITTSVLQVLARILFFGEGIKTSIDAPRIHHQLVPNELIYENLFPKRMVRNLRHFGHRTRRWGDRMNSNVMGIHRSLSGHLFANSDYRNGGDISGF